MATLESIFKHNPACPVRKIGEGLVIMAPDGETTHSLEEIGAFIWDLIDGSRDLQAILDLILAEYQVELETARADLLQFVDQMAQDGLVLPV